MGKKTGEGFYQWKNGKAQKEDAKGNNSVEASKTITDRLILPMLDARVICYHDGVIDDLDHLDGSMIFATGFAPFRSGPINYARTRGIDDIVNILNAIAEQYGERYKPNPGWRDL